MQAAATLVQGLCLQCLLPCHPRSRCLLEALYLAVLRVGPPLARVHPNRRRSRSRSKAKEGITRLSTVFPMRQVWIYSHSALPHRLLRCLCTPTILVRESQPRISHLPVLRSILRITRLATVAVLQPTFSVTVGAIDAVSRLVVGLLLWRAVHSC